MRVLIDYRAALSSPSGVGEYARQLVSGLVRLGSGVHKNVEVTIFSSSWKERLALAPELGGAAAVDQRIPVSLLNFAWHRLGWPQAEMLTDGTFDVAHSLHPLLMPTRSAAQVITIHDLNFLHHPERTRAEIRRDYPALAHAHAARADRILVPSRFTAREVEHHLGVDAGRISICSPGAPGWAPRSARPDGGYILFFGTLEPRKNLPTLLDAYERLLSEYANRGEPHRVPDLVVAGRPTPDAAPWLERFGRSPLAGRVRHIGYVNAADRRGVFEGARLLVQPSFEEGFGLPALEAMTLGVPVVAADRGAAPEVVGDAGLLTDPLDSAAMAAAIARILDDDRLEAGLASAGIARARLFPATAMAERAVCAYAAAIEHRASRQRLS